MQSWHYLINLNTGESYRFKILILFFDMLG